MINILFCSDNKYAPKLAVALSSLLAANRKIIAKLNIIIRTNDMREQTILRLRKIAANYGLNKMQLCFIYTDDLCRRLQEEKVKTFKGSYLCYFKLFGLDELLDDDQERLLVIDCDTLILDSLEPLYKYDLRGNAVGAVREFPARHTVHGKRSIGEYNTGVLLYDMSLYKELRLEEKMKETIKTISDSEWKTGDQTVFTLALEEAGLVETLPLKYNFIINQLYFSYKEFMYIRQIKNNYYCEQEYEDARRRPCIMHLISGEFVVSPWYYEGNRSIKNIWDMYLMKTEWRNNKNDVYEHLPLKKLIRGKICRAVHVFFPRGVSMRIYKKLYSYKSW